MKLKYPAEAFALGIVLFSGFMKSSFMAGSIIILAVVFAEFLKNLLENLVPDWSLKGCVYIGTASLSAAVFNFGLSAVSIPVEIETWILVFIIGLFAAKHVLTTELEAEYGEIFLESAIVWGAWMFFTVIREFFTAGKIFGYYIAPVTMQSKSFTEVFFGFLTAGVVLALANGILKKKCTGTNSMLLVIPIVLLARPFTMHSFGTVAGIIWTIIVPLVMFFSVRKTLRFSKTGQAFRGLPVEMLSMGFIYMILSIY